MWQIADAKPCAAGLTSCFQALPNVTNTWQALKADVKYMFTAKVEHVVLQMDVLQEIRRHLAPFSVEGHPISGETVISDATTVDSLTIMDMVMELEDRFDVTIPMNLVAEVRTVNQLADTILALSAKH